MGSSLNQILAVSIINVLLISFGMTLGFPTVLIADLESPILRQQKGEVLSVSEDQLSWIGALNLIFIPIGCLSSGPLSQTFGQKRIMQAATIPLVFAWLLLRFAIQTWNIYLALALFGILHGLIEAPVITYVAEITTPNLRGTLTSSSILCIVFGILIQLLLGAVFYWRTVAQVSIPLPMFALALLFFIPESPRWLVNKQRNKDAKEALIWFRSAKNPQDISEEYRKLLLSVNNNNNNNEASRLKTTCEKLSISRFWKPYILVSSVFLLRHFAGMTNIQTYSAEILKEFKSPLNKHFTLILLALVEFCGCLTCVCVLFRTGKRKLTIVCMSLSIFCLLLTVSSSLIPGHHHWIPLGGILGFSYFSHAGLRVLPWILIGEVFPHEIRPFAAGLSAATGYVFALAANNVFFLLKNALTLQGLFLFDCLLSSCGLIWLYFALPETEGKSLDEIGQHFAGKIETDSSLQYFEGSMGLQNALMNLNGAEMDDSNSCYRKFSTVDEEL